MATPSSRSRFRRLGLAVLLIATLAILRPWTVRPIRTSQPGAFDAAAYVAEAWPRVLDEAERTAIEIQAARSAAAAQRGGGAPSSRRPVFVRVTGVVTAIDRRSRVGVAHMRADTGSPALIAIQVGPVLRGTALRDAVGFLSFTGFANQSEFAAVSNALNDRVLRDVLGGLDVDSLPGRTLTVIGAASFAGEEGDRPVDIVPVKLRIEGGGR
jgi:predicted lipoprotein